MAKRKALNPIPTVKPPEERTRLRAVYGGLIASPPGGGRQICAVLRDLITADGVSLQGAAICPLTPRLAGLDLRPGDRLALAARVRPVSDDPGESRTRQKADQPVHALVDPTGLVKQSVAA